MITVHVSPPCVSCLLLAAMAECYTFCQKMILSLVSTACHTVV